MLDLIDVALEASRCAGDVLRRHFGRVAGVRHKGTVDLVSAADAEAEDTVLRIIRTSYPDHRIVAEESGEHDGTAEMMWYVDPLDGTTNFVHGFPHFAVSIAAATRAGALLAAVVHDPLRGETFRAVRGHGAFVGEHSLRVSTTHRLGDALVATGFPYDRQLRAHHYLPAFERVMRQAQGIRRLGAASLDLAYVACGRLDAYWEVQLQPWDTAAGSLLVLEAGGRVSAFDRSARLPLHEQVAASNGLLHEELLRAVNGPADDSDA